jgi:hypothetical protein
MEEGYHRLQCRENRSLLDRVALLQIRILSTEASAVPGLRRLRIVGRPASGEGVRTMARLLLAEDAAEGQR